MELLHRIVLREMFGPAGFKGPSSGGGWGRQVGPTLTRDVQLTMEGSLRFPGVDGGGVNQLRRP